MELQTQNVFSIFKRGMTGAYQHCASHHLHRYLSEFDFRYNNSVVLEVDDGQRADNILAGVTGKRVTIKQLVKKKRRSRHR